MLFEILRLPGGAVQVALSCGRVVIQPEQVRGLTAIAQAAKRESRRARKWSTCCEQGRANTIGQVRIVTADGDSAARAGIASLCPSPIGRDSPIRELHRAPEVVGEVIAEPEKANVAI